MLCPPKLALCDFKLSICRLCLYSHDVCSYYAFAFAVSIIQDAGAVVVNVYYIIQTILYSTVYPADIFLLFTVYTLLFHCFTKQGDDHRRKLKRNVFLAHGGFCAILGALYIAYLALSIQQTVQSVNDTLELEYRYYETIPAFHKVDVAFSALYFVASVEVLLATIYIFVTARKREIPSSVRYSHRTKIELLANKILSWEQCSLHL